MERTHKEVIPVILKKGEENHAKSKIYREAAVSVINAGHLTAYDKLEILEVLLSDRHLAEYSEAREREEQNVPLQ